jgi:hypothetical protein
MSRNGSVTPTRRCSYCKTPLRGKRADARTCKSACRQALHRSKAAGPMAAMLALADAHAALERACGGFEADMPIECLVATRRLAEESKRFAAELHLDAMRGIGKALREAEEQGA